jgi:nitrous oxidase accessory protein NosD
MRTITLGILAVAWMGSAAAPARAATTCVFDARGTRLVLRTDCETDASIEIPDGFTLDGRGRSIAAVDPPDGHFVGAIVRNAGATAHVRNLVVEARALANVCDPAGPPDLRLAGILLEDASGTVVGNRVLGINQGQSGCQEGAAIAVRSAAEGPLREVRIAGNRVEGYQKTGILVNGNASAAIESNRVVGLGPVDFIGQNGIQIGFGATGTVTRNAVSQNLFTQGTAASAGVLLLSAGTGVEVARNRIEDCDVGVSVVATSGALVRNNRIESSTYDGIAVDSRTGEANASLILSNLLIFNGTGIGVYGPQAEDNAIEDNRVRASSEIDIFNTGANTYSGNSCRTSSGPPVDCP